MLIYQDRKGGTPRIPVHLIGAAGIARRESFAGDLIATCDAMYLEEPAIDAVWLPLGQDWYLTSTGEFIPAKYLRMAASTPLLISIADAQGRAWHAPAILSPGLDSVDGDCLLPLAWAKDATGTWTRSPSSEQARWISAARAARREILANKLHEVPIAIAAEWCSTLLESVYHLNADIFGGLGLFDDTLVRNALMASAGFVKPRGNT